MQNTTIICNNVKVVICIGMYILDGVWSSTVHYGDLILSYIYLLYLSPLWFNYCTFFYMYAPFHLYMSIVIAIFIYCLPELWEASRPSHRSFNVSITLFLLRKILWVFDWSVRHCCCIFYFSRSSCSLTCIDISRLKKWWFKWYRSWCSVVWGRLEESLDGNLGSYAIGDRWMDT